MIRTVHEIETEISNLHSLKDTKLFQGVKERKQSIEFCSLALKWVNGELNCPSPSEIIARVDDLTEKVKALLDGR